MLIHIKCSYNNNLLHGEYVEYCSIGNILQKGIFFNDIKIGLWKELTEIGSYNLVGQRNGTWLRTRFNLCKISNYENDKITCIN
jgi:antitoxin component YwqK of YwqJK toxin-antitoxin module